MVDRRQGLVPLGRMLCDQAEGWFYTPVMARKEQRRQERGRPVPFSFLGEELTGGWGSEDRRVEDDGELREDVDTEDKTRLWLVDILVAILAGEGDGGCCVFRHRVCSLSLLYQGLVIKFCFARR